MMEMLVMVMETQVQEMAAKSLPSSEYTYTAENHPKPNIH